MDPVSIKFDHGSARLSTIGPWEQADSRRAPEIEGTSRFWRRLDRVVRTFQKHAGGRQSYGWTRFYCPETGLTLESCKRLTV